MRPHSNLVIKVRKAIYARERSSNWWEIAAFISGAPDNCESDCADALAALPALLAGFEIGESRLPRPASFGSSSYPISYR